jgi:hypothetical protein
VPPCPPVPLCPLCTILVSELRADLGLEWANELFTLSSQAPGAARSYSQDTAITILARLDPSRALELLHGMSFEEPETGQKSLLPNMQPVEQVFLLLIARDGLSAFPVLEQEAERLGIQGHYPYAALGQAAMQAVSKEWASNKPHAVEVVQAVFEREVARYSQDTRRTYFDDLEFGNMLQVVAGGLPTESVQPAVRMLVKNLLGADANKYQYEAKVHTNAGKTGTVINGIDAAILRFGALINRIDPELAQKLESTRPELGSTLEYANGGRQRMSMFGPNQQYTRLRHPDAETRMDALRLSHVNAEAAIAKVEQLPQNQKRDALLEVARSIAGDDPDRATELLGQVQLADNAPNEELQLSLISTRLCIAAAQDKKDELHELLQSGFALANRIISQQLRDGHVGVVAGLGELVQIGIQHDQYATTAFVQNLPPSDVRGSLGTADGKTTATEFSARTKCWQTHSIIPNYLKHQSTNR